MKRINEKKEIFGFFDLRAFKDGVANALLNGNVNEDVKDKFCRSSYQKGYDFGLTMYCRYNQLESEEE